jgi:hypothetical protein
MNETDVATGRSADFARRGRLTSCPADVLPRRARLSSCPAALVLAAVFVLLAPALRAAS